MNLTIFYSLLLALSLLLLLWFLLPIFTKRIINAGNATGISVSLLLILYTLFHNYVNNTIALGLVAGSTTKRALLIFFLLAALAILYFFLNAIRIFSAMHDKPHDNDALLLILGCRVYGERASRMLEERLTTAATYMQTHSAARCIVSGGKGDDEDIAEATCMQRWLIAHGIERSRILVEDTSCTTCENIRFSFSVIKKEGLASMPLTLVSNDFHLYRARRIARSEGCHATCLAAHTPWWLFATYFLRETLAIVQEDLRFLFSLAPFHALR